MKIAWTSSILSFVGSRSLQAFKCFPHLPQYNIIYVRFNDTTLGCSSDRATNKQNLWISSRLNDFTNS